MPVTAQPARLYRAFGLTIRSTLPLAPIPICANEPEVASPPDVTIDFGSVDPAAFGDGLRLRNWAGRPGALLFKAFEIGHFLIEDGTRITIDPHPAANLADLLSITLGTGITAMLQQRAILPLHANAIATDRGAVLTMGRSGAGKSTLLGALVAAGCTMIADDVTGVAFDETTDVPMAIPAFPAMRLWKDSLRLLGAEERVVQRVRENIEKFYLPVDRFHAEPMPIRMIVLLNSRNDVDHAPREIPVAQRVDAIYRSIHRKNFLKGLQFQQRAFAMAIRLAQTVEMVAMARPVTGASPHVMAQTVLALLEGDGERWQPRQRAAGE